MNKKRSSLLAGVLAVACMATGAALLKDKSNVTVSAATGTEFAMVDGAAVRLSAEDGKYGIRYTASLGVTEETAIAEKYGENDFYVMIIPEDYITKYNLTASTDLYGDLYAALKAEDENKEPYIATMNALPFHVTDADEAAELGLNVNEYYVRGSLTTVQYANLNRNFFGIAYYQDTENNRTYAKYEDNVRNLVNVSSKALNSGNYVDDKENANDDWDILRGFVKDGVKSASGGELDDEGAEAALSSITIQSEVKTLDKAETTVPVDMSALPAGVDIAVAWEKAENETVIEEVTDGKVVPKNWGETTVTAKVLGVSTSITVKSYKSDDWTFDIDEGCDAYYDFVKGTENDDLTSENFACYGSMTTPKIENGCLVIDNVNEWSEMVFMNESKLGNYEDGQVVYTQMRIKAVNKDTGEPHPWDANTAMLFAFPGQNSFGTLALRTAKSGEYWMEISGEDEEGFKTITWYRPVTDWYHANMGARAEDSINEEDLSTYRKTANNFALMLGNGWRKTNGTAEENYTTKLYIDWIKTGETATKCEGSVSPIATTTTYGGKANTQHVSTTATVEGVDVNTLTLGSGAPTVALAGANGKVTGGATAGSATITVNSAEGDEIVYGTLGTVDVYSAINSKHDLDMLALAYARGVAATDWGTSAKYMLTQDIDYNGELFIPIAAVTGSGTATANSIGKQWETVLANEETYGISFAEFVKTGLNNGTKFAALLDGNGYAVQNAKLMLDAVVVNTNSSTTAGSIAFFTDFIGYIAKEGKVRNLAIENLGLQTRAEAGYGVANTLYTVGTDIDNSPATVTYNAPGYIKTDFLGTFGIVYGTLENCYIEWTPGSVGLFGRWTQANFAFGRWDGATVKDCILIDTCTAEDANNPYIALRFLSGYTVTLENLLVVSKHTQDGGATVSGSYTQYADSTELQTAYDSDNTLFIGFEDWEITIEDNVLTCDIKNGIAG